MTIKQQDIQLEAALLKSLAVKTNYEKFYNVLDKKRLIPITSTLLKDYGAYFEKYKEDINWETFYNEFTQNWHTKDLDSQDVEYYRETVFPLVQNAEIKNNLYVSLLEREATAKINDIVDNGFNQEKIAEVLSGLKSQLQMYQKDNDDDVFKLGSLDLSVLDSSMGLEWFLPSLQAGMGSHMPGQFILVSADSGAGKSAFCISQATHVLRQINRSGGIRPILYATSEDTREDLAGRFLSNLYKDKCLGGFEDVVAQYEKVGKHFSDNYNEELFIGMTIRNAKDMHRIKDKISKYNPCVIVIDMIDVLSETLDINSLTKTYNDIRSIANDGYPIIGTTQAGNTSYRGEDGQYKHRKWLTEKDTAGSKGGGKQGAAYAMLMIGQDDDMPGVRYLTTTKKKRGKHVSVTCLLDEKYSLYKELL